MCCYARMANLDSLIKGYRMKNTVRIFTFLLNIFLLFAFFFCVVGAEEFDYRKSKQDALYALQGKYYNQLPKPETDEIYPSDAVWIYVDRLAKLPASYTQEQVDLLYEQGVASGLLTRIYYMHSAEIRKDETVSRVYLAQWNKIDPSRSDASASAPSLSFFRGSNGFAEVEDCYTELLSAIYSAKFQKLKHSAADLADSQIPAIIQNATEQLNALKFRTDFKPFYQIEEADYSAKSDNYILLYDRTETAVQIQRNREAATEELRLVYQIVRNLSDPVPLEALKDSDPLIGTFLSDIATMTATGDMNLALREAVMQLLKQVADGTGPYETAYLTELQNKVLTETNKDATRADISPFFETYHEKRTRAACKDTLTAYENTLPEEHYTSDHSAARKNLLLAYADPSHAGILDTCPLSQLAEQEERAKHRLLLYNAYVQVLYGIQCQVGTPGTSGYRITDHSELTQTAAALWHEIDSDIKEISTDPSFTRREGEAKLSALITEAKARAYENAHASACSQSENTTKQELKQAIQDAMALEDAVIAVLQNRQNGTRPMPVLTALGKRYQQCISREIAELLSGSDCAELRAKSITALQTALYNLPLTEGDLDLSDLTALPANADALSNKAEQLRRVLLHYRDNIDNDIKDDAMFAFCDTAASQIIAGTMTAEHAIAELNRKEAKAEIEKAAIGFTAVPGVSALLSTVERDLSRLSDADAIMQYQTLLIGKIEACQNAEVQIAELLAFLPSFTMLSEEEKADLSRTAQLRQTELAERICRSDAQDDIRTVLHAFCQELLSLAKHAAQTETERITSAALEQLQQYRYIEEVSKQAFRQTCTEEKQATDAVLRESTTDTIGEVTNEILRFQRAFRQLASTALQTEQCACCETLTQQLNTAYTLSDYSEEHQSTLLSLIRAYSDRLAPDRPVAENETVWQEACAQMQTVPNRLQEAQSLAEARLTSVYETLRLRQNCYSSENFTALTELYHRALAEIRQWKEVSDAEIVQTSAKKQTEQMQAIPLDRIYTDNCPLSESGILMLPDSYQPAENGYHGTLLSPNGIASDTQLHITAAEENNMAEKIKEVAKSKRIYAPNGMPTARSVLRLLKDCRVISALRIYWEGTQPPSAADYTVSVLLPADIDLSHVIGMIYWNEDGSAEYREITSEDTLIRFTASHGSDFYLVSENTISLVPWFVLLGMIIACEISVLILLYSHKKRQKTNVSASAFSVFPFFSLTVYRPLGGMWAIGILGIISLFLAVWIACLLRAEWRHTKAHHLSTQPKKAACTNVAPLIGTSSAPPDHRAAHTVKTEPVILPTVTAEEVHHLMSDDRAKDKLQIETKQFFDSEIYHGTKKAEINTDTISAYFQSGDIVTLNSLKEKKLLPANVGFVKVLARGSLDKPLTVIAQDFSTAALKMILLTGGTPLVTHASPERGGKRNMTQKR